MCADINDESQFENFMNIFISIVSESFERGILRSHVSKILYDSQKVQNCYSKLEILYFLKCVDFRYTKQYRETKSLDSFI